MDSVHNLPTRGGVSRRQLLKAGAGATLLAGFGGLLSACSSSSGGGGGDGGGPNSTVADAPKSPAAVTGELSVLVQAPQITASEYTKYKSIFAAKYPNVKVNYVTVPGSTWPEQFDQIQVRLAGGTRYDVIYVPTQGQQLFAQRGLLEPLDPYIERDKDEVNALLANISPHLIDIVNAHGADDGKKYFLPYVHNTMCMYINTQMFEDAGLDEPDESWTWDDFRAAAEKLTKPGKAYGCFVGTDEFVDVGPWLFTNSARMYSDDWKQALCDSPEAVESVDFMRALVSDKLAPEPTPNNSAQVVTQFASNQIGMFGSGRWGTVSLRAIKGAVEKTKILPYPKKTASATIIGTGALPIMASSKNKEAAWAFVKASLSDEIQQMWAEEGTEVPANKQIADSAAFTANSPQGSPLLESAVDNSILVGGQANGAKIATEINKSLLQILTGQQSTKDGLGALKKTIQGLL